MKTQEQLNQDYDRIMIDFKQRAFIEASLRHEPKLDDFVQHTFQSFSQHFNSEYQHIYLKPLCELLEKDFTHCEQKQTFLTVSKTLPSTFWNTALGEDIVLKQAKLSIEKIFVLPLTEERKLFFSHQTSNQDSSTIKELNNTDKIKIQETYSEFVDSFINSPILPESLKLHCFDLLIHELFYISNHSTLNNTLVNFTKDEEFIKDVLCSVKLNVPFSSSEINERFQSIFKRQPHLKP